MLDRPILIFRVYCIMYHIIQYLKTKRTDGQKYYGCSGFISGIDLMIYDRQLVAKNMLFCRKTVQRNRDFCRQKQYVLKSSFSEDISYMLYNMIFHLYINHYNYFILLFMFFPEITKLNNDTIEINLKLLKMKYDIQGDIYNFMHEVTIVNDKTVYDLEDIEQLLIQRFVEFISSL